MQDSSGGKYRGRTLGDLSREILGEVFCFVGAAALQAVEEANVQLLRLVEERGVWEDLFASYARSNNWSYPPYLLPSGASSSVGAPSSCRLPALRDAHLGLTDRPQEECPRNLWRGPSGREYSHCRECWAERSTSWKHSYYTYRKELALREKYRRSDQSAVYVLRLTADQTRESGAGLVVLSRKFTLGSTATADSADASCRWHLDLVRNPNHPDVIYVCLSLAKVQTARAFLVVRLLESGHARATTHTFESASRWYHRLPLPQSPCDMLLELDMTVLPSRDVVAPLGAFSRLLHAQSRQSDEAQPRASQTVWCDSVVYSVVDLLRSTRRQAVHPADRAPEFSAGRRADGGSFHWSLSLQAASSSAARSGDAWLVLSQTERVCVYFEMRVRSAWGGLLAEHCALHHFPGSSAADCSPRKGGCRFASDLFKVSGNKVEVSIVAFDDDVACVSFAFALASRRLQVGELVPSPVAAPLALSPTFEAGEGDSPYAKESCAGSSDGDPTPVQSPDCGPQPVEFPEAASQGLVYDCVYSAGFFIADRRIEEVAQKTASDDIIQLFCDSDAAPRLRSAASSTIWNLLDCAPIALTRAQVCRTAAAVNLYLGLALQEAVSDEWSDDSEEGAEAQAQLKRMLVRSMVGILSNLSVERTWQEVILAEQGLLAKVVCTLRQPTHWESHFSCFNLVSMIHNQGLLPSSLLQQYRPLLQLFCSAGGEEARARQKFNMRISLRDVTDFFLPLVTSTRLDCVRFGVWCMNLMYCTDAWQGDRTNI